MQYLNYLGLLAMGLGLSYEIWRRRSKKQECDHTDQRNLDQPEEPGEVDISLREVDLGECQIPCPHCGEYTDVILMGLSLMQHQESTEGDFFDITEVGLVAYPCGDIIYSRCLTPKVALILEACDTYTLHMDMISNLMICEEHGVSHTEES